jgi:peptide/nickel transport system substrate-binding protein
MKKLTITIVALFAALVAVGCGSGASSNGTLQTTYSQDPAGGLDPALFYDIEGESTLLAVYQGLLKFDADSTKLAPSLATSWDVSKDGKTYTFHLRKGVKFHDGTKFDSSAVKTSFEREIKLKGGPSYMLETVKSIETPDPNTVVIKLSKPDAAFLADQASMYGPKVISPTALRKHASSDDAQKWLTNHAVGTGPFELASYKGGQQIVLKRFDGYWGPKAKLKKVVIAINPNVGDQLLQLRSGQVDAIPHGIQAAQLPSIQGDSSLAVETPTALIREVLVLNPARPPFDNVQNRQAAAAALTIPQVAQRIYPDVGKAPERFYPPGLLPDADNPPLPKPGNVKFKGDKSIQLAYTANETDSRRTAELLQQQLQTAGFKVSLKADTSAAQFAYVNDPAGAPNAVVTTFNPDTVHPDSWIRPIYYTASGLNLLGFSDPTLDKAIDAASSATDGAESNRLYRKAGELAANQWTIIPLIDQDDTIVSRSEVSNFGHVPAYVWAVDFSTITK